MRPGLQLVLDVIVFQFKLAADGLRDVVLVPLSLITGLMGLIALSSVPLLNRRDVSTPTVVVGGVSLVLTVAFTVWLIVATGDGRSTLAILGFVVARLVLPEGHRAPLPVAEMLLFPLELALVENLQREDLNPIDEARGYESLM